MKKLTCVVVFIFIMMLGAIASAQRLVGDSENVDTAFGPMLVKTLRGSELDGITHAGLNIIEDNGRNSLELTNSRKEKKVNLVVMRANSVQPFLTRIDTINRRTQSKGNGPTFVVSVNKTPPPQELRSKLEKLGIKQPIMVHVISDKKPRPNVVGGILVKAALAFLI